LVIRERFLKQITSLPGCYLETMKTFAARPNPAFKIAQPLPLWPVASSAGNGSHAAGAAGLFPTQAIAIPEALDLAQCAMPEKRAGNPIARSATN
jgi:hypothetical protein